MLKLTEKDWELIRYIQGDLPTDHRPFLTIAQRLGWSEDEVIERIRQWMDQGIIKRLGTLVHHRSLGFEGNAMVAWSVPQSEAERIGKRMAGYAFISHCYERVIKPNWPYNIYTMIHASNRQEAGLLIEKVAEETGIKHYRVLYTIREWKKKSMEYS